MSNLFKSVKTAINNNKFSIRAEYCHGERVPEPALRHAETTSYEALALVTDEEIRTAINDLGNDDTVTADEVLTRLADWKCDHSGFSTITPVVIS